MDLQFFGGRGSSSSAGAGGGFNSTDRFFGQVKKTSGKYFQPKSQVIDDDNIILITNNVTSVKGNPVMTVGPNQAVYLKDWNMSGVGVKTKSGEYVGDSVAVKVSRKYFKPYTFKSQFDSAPSKQMSFDDLKKVAKQQSSSGTQLSPFMINVGNTGISKVKNGAKLGF